MKYLRALWPGHAHSASSASPVLPSRYAQAQPLQWLAPRGSMLPEGAAEPPDAGARSRLRERAEPPSRSRLPSADLPERASGRAGTAPSAAGLAAKRASMASQPAPDAAVFQRQVPKFEAGDARSEHAAEPAGGAAVSIQPATPGLDSRTRESAARSPQGSVAPAARPVAPLSEAALAQRSASVAPRAPVIQVTIDRVEVRAPATAPRAQAPAARPRAQASGTSLADYLRSSQRKGRA